LISYIEETVNATFHLTHFALWAINFYDEWGGFDVGKAIVAKDFQKAQFGFARRAQLQRRYPSERFIKFKEG
jgi:hypothetical protein